MRSASLLALLAVRNWAFASLLLVMLAPRGFDRALRKRPPRPAPAVGAVIAGVAASARSRPRWCAQLAPAANLTRNYPAARPAAAAAASRPARRSTPASQFADWLLWTHPELAGKVVFDVRYELLHASEVKRLVLFDAGSQVDVPLGQPVPTCSIPTSRRTRVKGLRPDVRTVYKTDHAVVAVARNDELENTTRRRSALRLPSRRTRFIFYGVGISLLLIFNIWAANNAFRPTVRAFRTARSSSSRSGPGTSSRSRRRARRSRGG